MTAKSLIHYFEVNCKTGKCIRTDFVDGVYEIVANEINDPGIETWIMERLVALTKLRYISDLYLHRQDPGLERRLNYLLRKGDRAKNIRISIDPKRNTAHICYIGMSFDLKDFDCYEGVVSTQLEKIRYLLNDKIDKVMSELGKVCEEQDQIEQKIKDLGLENGN